MDILLRIDGVTSKKMFGGLGIMLNGKMFALIKDSELYFKTDDRNRKRFTDAGMTAFLASEKKKGMPYFEVPPYVVSDTEALLDWVQSSLEIASEK